MLHMKTIVVRTLVWVLLLRITASSDQSFIFNAFRGANLSLNGLAEITSDDGLLRLTNTTTQHKGHAFYPTPIRFEKSSSFSTTFVFSIMSEYPDLSGHGIAFTLSPTTDLPGSLPSQFLGLFNNTNNGNSSNHVVAVELDTILSTEFDDIDDNHVGIDVNDLRSANSTTAGYFIDDGGFRNLSLRSGEPMQLWVEYDGTDMRLNVTLFPIGAPKPEVPLLSKTIELSKFVLKDTYVGFSSSTGSIITSHYILGWSFKMNGKAADLHLSELPSLPRIGPKDKPRLLTVGLPVILSAVVFAAVMISGIMLWRRYKYAELLEDWELECGPRRFSYKDLYQATKGFKEREIIGRGGFGRVYKGVLLKDKREVAVKRVSHESRQGLREFLAEIASIGRLRHRNIVQLLGYCRRKGELLLVYDYMSNGSLDKFLFDKNKQTVLNWRQRFHIVKGVASGVLYLHEGWEQLVVHRDIKSSNVLLDGEMNGRLGDFRLSRLYNHGTDPQTTRVAGTLGYIAPELPKTGRNTVATDVFAFGAFLLEVACGRRSIESSDEVLNLVDWVIDHWRKGAVMETVDARLGSDDFVAEEVELVIKLGLLCTHVVPRSRPNMRQVMQFLDRDIELPGFSLDYINGVVPEHDRGFDDFFMSDATSSEQTFFRSSMVEESLLFGGGR